MYKTCEEWKLMNCFPKKGEKSPFKNREGVALFSNMQVVYHNQEHDFGDIFMEQLERECTGPNG